MRNQELFTVRIFRVSEYVDIVVAGTVDEAEAQKKAIAIFNEENPKMTEVSDPTILALTMNGDLPEGERIH